METAKRIIILLATLALIVGAVQSAEKPAETKSAVASAAGQISNTRSASCVVRITAHPAVLPLTFDTIQYLLHSSGVAGKAARDTLGLPPDVASGLFTIEELYSAPAVSMPLYPPGQTPPVGPGFGDYGNLESPSGEPPASPESLAEPEQPGEEEPSPSTTGYNLLPRSSPMPAAPPIPRGTYGRLGGYGGGYGGYGGGYGGYGGSYGGGGFGSGYGFNAVPGGLPPANPEQPVVAVEQTLLFGLVVNFDTPWPVQKPTIEARPAAEELMHAIVTNLRENLLRVWGEQRMRLDSQEKTAQEEAQRSQRILEDYQQELRKLAGSRNLSRTEILSRCEELRNKLERAQMDMASDELMIKSIGEQIAQTMNKLDTQIKEDAVTSELERMLKIQTDRYATAEQLHAQSTASSAEVADALEKVTRARIELAQRREQLSKAAGGDKISSLNNRVADLSLKMTQMKAYQERFEKQLAEAEELLTKADTYELLSLKADLERQNLQQALVWRDAISRQIRMLQEPQVSVLGGQ
jgi:Arc/MetJ family transcription regulator/uncharacterized membrane protein YgcG